jgi:hypothetical protein
MGGSSIGSIFEDDHEQMYRDELIKSLNRNKELLKKAKSGSLRKIIRNNIEQIKLMLGV